jgi:S-adenosylmethionine:tRNA ribosyltransferase-isomerase
VVARREGFFELEYYGDLALEELFEKIGRVPLPPYIQRPDEVRDREAYQTVYARKAGAVAAPTAGLHFTRELLDELQQAGIAMEFITLNVGAGTFRPVKHEDPGLHVMHTEHFAVADAVCQAVEQCRQQGGRVIAVGTTSVRALESAAASGRLQSCETETDMFVRPGFRFRVVDGLITNFHLPRSTLLMLVSAFAGYRLTMAAYQHAIHQRYRFFSYGDAMLILD